MKLTIKKLASLIKEAVQEQMAYHGTVHNFNQFNLDKVKRSMYGFGINVAVSKDEAAYYSNGKFIYSVDIPDDNGENYAEWTKPMTDGQWNAFVQKARSQGLENDIQELLNEGRNGFRSFYLRLCKIYGWQMANAFFYSIGIKGIRTQEFSDNSIYVLFNPKDVKIIEKKNYNPYMN